MPTRDTPSFDISQKALDTSQKALQLNLDAAIYGTIAEIGAGQEVARHFFSVGGASGTVAKTMSAYDMKFSDEIYGTVSRYVSRERLLGMLSHEFDLLLQRLGGERGDRSTFFAFADTVAAQSYSNDRASHGWLGLRFQATPHGAPNDVILHVWMHDKSNALQQQALGALGVNLIYGAFRQSPDDLIKSLLDGLDHGRLEIDMIEFHGPAFSEVDNREMALKLVRAKLTNAVLISPDGEVTQPAEAFYKRPVLLQRGSFRPVTRVAVDMIEKGREEYLRLAAPAGEIPLPVLEITIQNLFATEESDLSETLQIADTLSAIKAWVLITNYAEHYRLTAYLRRFTAEPIALVVGPNTLFHLFNETYYESLEGGILEAFGRLFKQKVKVFVYPMSRETFVRYFESKGAFPAGLQPPEDTLVTAENLKVATHLRHLYAQLLEAGVIVGMSGVDSALGNFLPLDVLTMLRAGDEAWKTFVPATAVSVIDQRKLFRR
ncbi:MAG: hypothetical protein KDD69_04550 [Bdellovibrionales bacterium]|nr:hypothetical protein [Bdellovibrionales bacterium]